MDAVLWFRLINGMVEKTIGRDDTVESKRVTYDSMLMEIIKIGNSQ